jgi:glycosyltransferase involved in cell wall biosynthesis
MKVAIVYDRVNKYGGAERVLEAMHQIWPDAPIYTAVYNPQHASWAKNLYIKASFLNILPFASMNHELLPWITPMAFESFNFDAFDVVISVTSAEAKSVITKTNTLHICFCLTPTRYLWSGYYQYLDNPGFGIFNPLIRKFFSDSIVKLRDWDLISSARPDCYIAISDLVSDRIKKYYRRPVDAVIYPPVDLTKFQQPINSNKNSDDYYLTVSRLVPYKKNDIIIRAFNRLGLNLVIIGNGRDLDNLQKIAKSNILFVTENLTDDKLVDYYKNCRAFIFAAQEDFGLAAVEAQAFGKPVIGYKNSGLSETVIDGKTGILYSDQTTESLINAIYKSQKIKFAPGACVSNAKRFTINRFQEELKRFVEKKYKKFIKGIV